MNKLPNVIFLNQVFEQQRLMMQDNNYDKILQEMNRLQEEKRLQEEEARRHILALRDESLNKELMLHKDMSEIKQMMLELRSVQNDDRKQLSQLKEDREPLLVDKIDKEKWKVIGNYFFVKF